MPVMPAIFFGILSKKVTFKGAIASVLVGAVMAAVFVSDQWMGVEAGTRWFPWIHHSLTLNYSFRGLWGTLVIICDPVYRICIYREDGPRETGENYDSMGRKDGAFRGAFRLALASGPPVRLNCRSLCLAMVEGIPEQDRCKKHNCDWRFQWDTRSSLVHQACVESPAPPGSVEATSEFRLN